MDGHDEALAVAPRNFVKAPKNAVVDLRPIHT